MSFFSRIHSSYFIQDQEFESKENAVISLIIAAINCNQPLRMHVQRQIAHLVPLPFNTQTRHTLLLVPRRLLCVTLQIKGCKAAYYV